VGLHRRGLGRAEIERFAVGPAGLPHNRNHIFSCSRRGAAGHADAAGCFTVFKPDPNLVRPARGDIGCGRCPPDDRFWETLLDPLCCQFLHLVCGPDHSDLLRQHFALRAAATVAKRRDFLCEHGAGIHDALY